jgi:dTDP-glucose 4,6-dehydratase
MLTGKKIFITGGAGFIGTNIIKRLIDNNEIVVYDTLQRDSITNSPLKNHPNLRLIQGDVLDKEKVEEAMQLAEIVIHLAAVAGIDTVVKSPTTTMKVNLIGTYNVLEAARKRNIEVFIDFSTSEVYGPRAFKTDENDNTSTGPVGENRWTYSTSKLAAEHLTHSYYREFGLPAISVRPFNIYGPGQVGEGAINNFIGNALKGENLKIFGSGDQVRAWCYVDDIVDVVLLCLENKDAIGNVFNVGNPGGTITTLGLAEKIIALGRSGSKIEFVDREGYADVELRIPSIEKAKKILGYEPKIGLKDGLAKTIEWYKNKLNN